MQTADAEVETIDGLERPVEPIVMPASSLPPPIVVADYPDLVTVDRRHYVISGEIAKGGMGRVLDARDLRLGRAVAIKELLPKNRDAARRFEREARITARLQHPAIIHIYEAGVWSGGEPFYAMTKVVGRSLDKVVAERSSLEERLGLVPNVIAVADALAYAHHENVIHRDLKPANVLVGSFGETVVIDWGLAKDLGAPPDPKESLAMRPRASPGETNAGSIVGTPAYMPPEQARGESVDQRADVYALGALLYHVLVGAPPYTGKSSAEVLELVKAQPWRPIHEREPGAPADLVAIVTKAMARDPFDRYGDAEDLAHDLKRFQTGQLVAAHHYTTPQLFWRWLRRYRVPVSIATIALVVIAVLGSLSISRILHEQQKDERRRYTLLEERGRTDLLDGHAGRALANLVGASHDGEVGGARGFLIADAMRPFEAEVGAFAPNDLGPSIVAYSPDGRHVAIARARGIELWSANGTREASFATDRVQLIRFDRQSARVLIAGADGVAHIWTLAGIHVRDLKNPANWADGIAQIWPFIGIHERDLQKHAAAITDADFSNDGQVVVIGDADGVASVWNLKTTEFVASTETTSGITRVKLSPKGDMVVIANEDTTMYLWSRSSEIESSPLRGHRGRVNTIRWNPDPAKSQILTAGADGTARLWDPVRGKELMVPLRHEVGEINTAVFSSDGRLILTAGADHVVEIWKIPDEFPVDDPTKFAQRVGKLVGHADAVESAVFSADDELIATAGHDKQAKVWVAKTGQLIATFEHADVVNTVAFSSDHTRLFTGSRDGGARLWDITRGEERRVADLESVVHAIAVARDGSVATGTSDTLVTLWRAAGSLPALDTPTTVMRTHMGRVFAVAFAPDGNRLASAGEDPQVLVWDLITGKHIALEGHDQPVRSVAFSPDGETVATAGDEGLVRQWSAATGTLLRTLGKTQAISSITYGPDGTLIGIGDDGALLRWDAISGAATTRNLKARALVVRHDGKAVAISGTTDTEIFALDGGQLAPYPMLRLDGPTGEVRAVAFTPDGSRVITASTDGIVRVWDAKKGKLVGTRDAHGGPITSVALSVDGNTLWVASEDHSIRAWDIHVESRPAAELERFLADHVPWRLAPDDVVRLKTEGDGDGQR